MFVSNDLQIHCRYCMRPIADLRVPRVHHFHRAHNAHNVRNNVPNLHLVRHVQSVPPVPRVQHVTHVLSVYIPEFNQCVPCAPRIIKRVHAHRVHHRFRRVITAPSCTMCGMHCMCRVQSVRPMRFMRRCNKLPTNVSSTIHSSGDITLVSRGMFISFCDRTISYYIFIYFYFILFFK